MNLTRPSSRVRLSEIRHRWTRDDPSKLKHAIPDVIFLMHALDRLEHESRSWLYEVSAEDLAKLFYETFQSLSPCYETDRQPADSVPWEKLTGARKQALTATAQVVLEMLARYGRRALAGLLDETG